MKIQPVIFVAIGVVTGFLISSFLSPNDTASVTSAPLTKDAKNAGSSDRDSSDKDQRIAALTEELEATKQKLAAGSQARVGRTAQEFMAWRAQQERGIRGSVRQREIDALIKAGFSAERIEWARRRTEELLVKQQEDVDENRAKGVKFDVYKAHAYMLDPDLDLRLEMGEAEYEKYRRALGRPDGVGVASVLATSNVEIAGLQAGDEILSYDGKRVYNQGMLDGLAAARTSSAPAAVEVRRNGQILNLAVTKGRVGIRNVNIFTDGGRTSGYPN